MTGVIWQKMESRSSFVFARWQQQIAIACFGRNYT